MELFDLTTGQLVFSALLGASLGIAVVIRKRSLTLVIILCALANVFGMFLVLHQFLKLLA